MKAQGSGFGLHRHRIMKRATVFILLLSLLGLAWLGETDGWVGTQGEQVEADKEAMGKGPGPGIALRCWERGTVEGS